MLAPGVCNSAPWGVPLQPTTLTSANDLVIDDMRSDLIECRIASS